MPLVRDHLALNNIKYLTLELHIPHLRLTPIHGAFMNEAIPSSDLLNTIIITISYVL